MPASSGWFVMNARDARWFHKPKQGHSLPLTGYDEYEAETFFPMLGMSIRVMGPGEPTATYHWETEQEDFLVLAGEALLIVEGQERRLKQWDFVHCPPETRHVFVGSGDGPCVILCASLPSVPEGRPVGLLLRRRDRRAPQRELTRGHPGRRRSRTRVSRRRGRCATARACFRTERGGARGASRSPYALLLTPRPSRAGRSPEWRWHPRSGLRSGR